MTHKNAGSGHPQSKLCEHDVAQILELLEERERRLAYANELTHDKIAQKFDVSVTVVRSIKNGTAWRHV